MKTKWREIIIVVVALLLISLVISGFAGWDNTKPSDSDAIYTWPASIRTNWDAIEDGFTGGINVKIYGAVGNGVTDDTAAFTTVEALGGNARMFLPDGTYIVNGITLSKYYYGPGIVKLDGVDKPPRTQIYNSAVIMSRTGYGTWVVYRPDGLEIDISSSTTDGLQEAIDYAFTNRWDLFVFGGGRDTTDDTAMISCTTPISVPIFELKSFHLHGVSIGFSSALGGDPGWRFDSCMLADFYHSGQIIYEGLGDVLQLAPTNPGFDNMTTIVDSTFRFGAIVATAASVNRAVFFDTNLGAITNNTFTFQEINGGDQYLYVQTTAANAFTSNYISCPHLHDSTDAAKSAVLIGTEASSNIHSNQWKLTIDTLDGQRGIDTWEQNSLYFCVVSSSGTPNPGIFLESTAAENQFFMGKLQGGIYDNSTTKNNKIIYPGSQGDLRNLTIDVTISQIKDLAATPKELIPAPGAGKLLEFVSAVLLLDYGTEVLAEPSAPDDLAIEYDDGSGQQIVTWDTTGFITNNADAMEIVNAASVGGGGSAITTAANVNKNIVLINTGGNYTGNASNNTAIRVIITYRVHNSLSL